MFLLAAIQKFHGEAWAEVFSNEFTLEQQASIAHAVWSDINDDITVRRSVTESEALEFILSKAVAITQSLDKQDPMHWFVWGGYNENGTPITDAFCTLDYIKDPDNNIRYSDSYGNHLYYINGIFFRDVLYRRGYTAPSLCRRLKELGYKTEHPYFDSFCDGVIKYQRHLRSEEDAKRKLLIKELK